MAVADEPVNYSYLGDGANKTFAFPSYFMDAPDLYVEITDLAGNVTTPVFNTDYTVTGVTDEAGKFSSGGSVVFTVAPGNGFTVYIERRTPRTQPYSYPPLGAFSTLSHEHAIDRQALINQEIWAALTR
jgi:hypothetical protein